MKTLNLSRVCAGLLLSLLLSTNAMAGMVFHVTVDTSTLAGSNGYLDLQFNPGDSSAANANALLTGFTGDITLMPGVLNTGDVSGALPGAVLFNNSQAFNDLFQAVSFGSGFAFDINFSGDFLTANGSTGTSFALALYGDDQLTPLLTTDANGTLLTSELAAGGVVTHFTFDADVLGSPSVVNVTATPVPVPAALWLLVSGLGCMPLFRKRHA